MTIGEQFGKPPIGYGETGNFYIHPALARELDKPENESWPNCCSSGCVYWLRANCDPKNCIESRSA
jgi:hypothetical protein